MSIRGCHHFISTTSYIPTNVISYFWIFILILFFESPIHHQCACASGYTPQRRNLFFFLLFFFFTELSAATYAATKIIPKIFLYCFVSYVLPDGLLFIDLLSCLLHYLFAFIIICSSVSSSEL